MAAAAATAAAGWIAAPAVTTALAKVRSLLEDCPRLRGEAEELVSSVGFTLNFIHEWLQRLEGHHETYSDENVRMWAEKLRFHVIYVEDLLDTIKVKSVRMKKKKRKKNKKVKESDGFSGVIEDADQKKLKIAVLELDSYSDQLRKLSGDSWMHKPAADDVGFLAPMKKAVIGREAETEQLLYMLLSGSSSHKNPRLICMVGEAGIGKSCLSRQIFENPTVRIYFDLRGWTVRPNRTDLVGDIISAFATEGFHFDSEKGLYASHQQLSRMISMRRFLLVLDNAPDDVDKIWTVLCPIFATAGPGSAVLVITKSADAAARLGALTGETNCFMLLPLPQSTMCSILEHHSGIGVENNDLKQMGETICTRLHGLPLLAELIGRLLSKNLSKDYWQSVMNSSWWAYYGDHEYPGLTAMAVVSEKIAVPLRRCLGYSSIFPEGCSFYKKKLMTMWSENFGYDDSIRSHKDEIFYALESMGLLQQSKYEDMYTMNEVVRETAAYIDRNGLYGTSYKDSVKCFTKELINVAVDVGDTYLYRSSSKNCRWRTLVLLDDQGASNRDERLADILSDTSGLRVLDLSTVQLHVRNPPMKIQDLMLLSVLDLSFTYIKIFPEFLCGLTQLKFLGLKGCKFAALPKKITKLTNLQHLFAEPDTYAKIRKVGNLTGLLDLQLFRVKRAKGYHITELRNLSQVSGTIQIENLEVVSSASEAAAAELYKKENLRRLVLIWDVKAAHVHSKEVLERLEQPRNLEELRICGYSVPSFPTWVGQGSCSQKLRYIEIVRCIKLDRLPPLGLLPCLESLLLQGLPAIKEITSTFYGSKPNVFESLEEITLHDMPNLEQWTGLKLNQQIPKLRKVQILKCKRLEEAPLHSFKGPLLDLILSDCPFLLESTGSCLSGLETVKHLTIENSSELITLPWNSLLAVEVLKIEKCDNLSLDGSKLLCNIKRIIRDGTTVTESSLLSLLKTSGMLHTSTSSAAAAGKNRVEQSCLKELSSDPSQQPSLYGKVTDPTLAPLNVQDSSGFRRSVYERDHALITPENHVFHPLPDWSKTLGAYLIIPDIGANFSMYLAKMEDGSKSAGAPKGVERFIFVLKGSISLSLASGTAHSLSVDSYAYIPANTTHYVASDESTTLVVFEKRYTVIEEYHADLIVSSADNQPFFEIPGEVFRLKKLLPTSMPHDFNIHIMDFQPGEYHRVKESHYNQHGLLFLEGQGIYLFGEKGHRVEAGDTIWTAPFLPHWYAALGKTKTRCLLYADGNRNPLLSSKNQDTDGLKL